MSLHAGFTLVEVLVATACAGLVLAAATGAWHALAGTHARLEAKTLSTQALRTAQMWFDDDRARATGPLRRGSSGWTWPCRAADGKPGVVLWDPRPTGLVRTWRAEGREPLSMTWPTSIQLVDGPADLAWEHAGRRLPTQAMGLRDAMAP
jgi:prepilin-type N-terminal cleavage/methylation domain-containing protein